MVEMDPDIKVVVGLVLMVEMLRFQMGLVVVVVVDIVMEV